MLLNQVIEPQQLEFEVAELGTIPDGQVSGTVRWFGSQINVEGHIDAVECRRRSVRSALAPILDLRALSVLSGWPVGVSVTLPSRDWRAQTLRRRTGLAVGRSGNSYWRLARPPVAVTSVWLVASDLEDGVGKLSKLPRLPGLGIWLDTAAEVSPFDLYWADWLDVSVSRNGSVLRESTRPTQAQDPTGGSLWHLAETVLGQLVLECGSCLETTSVGE